VEIKLKSGQPAWVEKMTGKVVKSTKFASTSITSHGGGGTIHKGSGIIRAPIITSTTTDQTEFFLRSDSGPEKGFTLCLGGLHIREGHRITVVWCAAKEVREGPCSLVINHDTDEMVHLHEDATFIEPYGLTTYLRKKHLQPYWIGVWGSVTLVGALIMGGALNSIGGFVAGALIFGVLGLLLMFPIGNLLGSLSMAGDLREIVEDLREEQRKFALNITPQATRVNA
jgi:hypothetical protein